MISAEGCPSMTMTMFENEEGRVCLTPLSLNLDSWGVSFYFRHSPKVRRIV